MGLCVGKPKTDDSARPLLLASQFQLFACGDPLRARTLWASRARNAFYWVAPQQGCPSHVVVYDRNEARAVLDALEADGTVWKTGRGVGVLNDLLGEAVTSAMPDDWRRARPEVVAAIGMPDTFSDRFSAAGEAATKTLLRCMAAAGDQELNLKVAVEEAACTAIVQAVVGTIPEAAEVEKRLLRLWRAVRAPPHMRSEKWGDLVQGHGRDLADAVRAVAKGDNGALLQRLAARPSLSLGEACGNAHSFLLAGFEAINCVTLFTLLHLSREKELQVEVAEEVRVAAGAGPLTVNAAASCPKLSGAVAETLRLYPPVMSLPRFARCPKKPDSQGEVGCSCKETLRVNVDGADLSIPHGSRVTVCTAAGARISAGGEELDSPSEWRPSRPDTASQMMPFGAGLRRCPGGQVGMSLVRVIVGGACRAYALAPGTEPKAEVYRMRQQLEVTAGETLEQPRYPWECRLRQVPTLLLAGPAMVTVKQREEDGCRASPAPVQRRCLLTIHGKEYDVTAFATQHPGGASVLLEKAGQDVTEEFDEVHGDEARAMLPRFLAGAQPDDAADLADDGWVSATVMRRTAVTADSVRLRLRAAVPVITPPGGHVRLLCGGSTRSYTPVACAESGEWCDVVVKKYPQGTVSVALHALQVGSSVRLSGPIPGRYTFREDCSGLVLCGGGTGAAPILSLARAAAAARCRCHVVISDKTTADGIVDRELDDVVASSSGTVQLLRVYTREAKTPPGSHAGRVTTDVLRRFLPAPREGSAAVVCGTREFDRDVKAMLDSLGYATTVL